MFMEALTSRSNKVLQPLQVHSRSCRDWLLISLSHSHSFFKSGNCLIKSKQTRFALYPAYAVCLVSKARLYTKRAEPICLFKSTDWSMVGYKRYLKAFSIRQICEVLQEKYCSFKNHLQPYHRKSHSKYLVKLHFVVAAKYRKKLLQGKINDDIQQMIFDVCSEKGIAMDAMESDKDHLHILVDIPPTLSAFDVVHRIKQITTHGTYKLHRPFLKNIFGKRTHFGQTGTSCVPLEMQIWKQLENISNNKGSALHPLP